VSVEIRQLERRQMSELRDFLKAVYPDDLRKSDPKFLDWYFLRNPNVDPESIPLWITVDNGKIVGQLATILAQLKVGATKTDAIWILEFILLPEYRGKGLGKKMVTAAQQKYPTMITLGINEASTRVFDSLGWARMGSICRYHRLLYAGNALRDLANFGFATHGLNLLSAPFRISTSKHKLISGYQIKHASALDPAFDELWAEASCQWNCCVHRDRRFVDWQFREQPGKRFQFVFLFKRAKLVGYVALFFRSAPPGGYPPKAAISDLVYSRESADEVIDILVEAALDAAIQRRAGSLVTDILDKRAENSFARHGFWRMKNAPRFMACTHEYQDLLYKPENWYLTRADSDVSIFEEPNAE
jgi:GNAT superfamily N-acetyltransferase